MTDKELYDKNPKEYFIRIFKAKAKVLERGFEIKDIEGKELNELETFLENSFEVRISPSINIIVVKDSTIDPNTIYFNGMEIKLRNS